MPDAGDTEIMASQIIDAIRPGPSSPQPTSPQLTPEQRQRLDDGEDPRIVLDPEQFAAYERGEYSGGASGDAASDIGNAFVSAGKGLASGGKRIGQALGIVAPDDVQSQDAEAAASINADRVRLLQKEEADERELAEALRRAKARADAPVDINAEDEQDQGDLGYTKVSPTRNLTSEDVTNVPRVDAPDVEGPRDVRFTMGYKALNAPDIGNADQASGVSVARTKIDGSATQTRADRIRAAEGIRNATGSAGAAFRAAMLASQEAQLGTASQVRGAERAGARREAMLGIGRDSLIAAEKVAELGAREEQAAAKGYSDALSGIASSDENIATAQANIDAARALKEGDIAADTERFNADKREATRFKKADMALDVDAKNRDHELALNREYRDTAEGNVLRTQAARDADAQRKLTAAIDNAGRTTTVHIRNADARNDIETGNVTRAQQVSMADADAANHAATTTYTTRAGVRQRNVDRRFDAAVKREDARNARADTYGRAAAGYASRPDRATSATADALELARIRNGLAAGNAERREAANGRLVNGLTTLGAAALNNNKSDERVKTDKRAASDKDLAELAKAFKAATFRYKAGHEDNGANLHAGVMAQDIEKTKIGKGLVHKDKDGIRHLDRAGLAMMLAAAAAKSMRASA